jgi:hypothetical protein
MGLLVGDVKLTRSHWRSRDCVSLARLRKTSTATDTCALHQHDAHLAMTPTPHRIAQTSTELKRQHRKNGNVLSERQKKQLERELELNQRAAHAREAEERRKAAMKRRKEKEVKEAAARKQLGVGLATQMIGYSHTQARLKNGMEAFLGLTKKKDEAKRQKELELTKKLEETVAKMEKEPWDDEDEDNAPDLPELNASLGEQWADDDLDDDSLLEAHNLVMSDSAEEPTLNVQPRLAPHRHIAPTLPLAPIPPKLGPVKEDIDFTRTHGPINKIIEAVLDKLPEPMIELLSQDVSLKTPEWDPAVGLLHKLNPVGLPPHRLRLKVGCVITLLRDLNTSSQLSRSQHLRLLRSENDRLECLVLDGQLKGTKAFLTRVPFCAKYKNLDQHPFQRTQFPICVAIDYTPSQLPRETPQTGFKLPSIPGRTPPAIPSRKPTAPVPRVKPQENFNPGFRLPGLPASRSISSDASNTTPTVKTSQPVHTPSADCWDDFFESSTQISREIASEANSEVTKTKCTSVALSPPMVDDLPPMSTQDLDFSLDDLDDEPLNNASESKPETTVAPSKAMSTSLSEEAVSRLTKKTAQIAPTAQSARSVTEPAKYEPAVARKDAPACSSVVANSSRPLKSTKKIAGKCWNPGPFATGIDIELAKLTASQLPKSMSGPSLKRRATTVPSKIHAPPAKRQYTAEPHSKSPSKTASTTVANASFDDFVMSTQDVASFFDDDDNLSFGSPPIAV